MSLRAAYRVRQFWFALVSRHRPVEESWLLRHLNAAQVALFRGMSGAEQAHALAVLRTLQSGACTEVDPALTQAALLHDVGKVGGRIQLGHRVAAVLLNAVSPELLHRLALDEPRSWRYPFFVLLHHAERGADLAADAGTDAVAVALIRAHHTLPEQSGLQGEGLALLVMLRAADGVN